MIELPIFVSYRQSDGTPLAICLRRHLHGRTFVIGEQDGRNVTASVYVDQCVPAEADWAEFLNSELSRAAVLIVLCTPDACVEKPSQDWFYHELRWWIENRSAAPLLVRPSGIKSACVPLPILDSWPRAEIVRVDSSTLAETEEAIQRIIGGIRRRVQRTTELPELRPAYDATGLFTWEKDKHFKYIRCNENYAAAAGLDSPRSIVGKTDDDMPWRALADMFRTGDYGVITGRGQPRFHVQEKEIMVDRNADILVTENQLLDHRGDCIGVTGYFIDITGRVLVDNPQSAGWQPHDLSIGGVREEQAFSPEDAAVALDFLRKVAAKDWSGASALSTDEIDSRIASIKSRLQCRTNGDLAATLIRNGIPLQLLSPTLAEHAPKPKVE